MTSLVVLRVVTFLDTEKVGIFWRLCYSDSIKTHYQCNSRSRKLQKQCIKEKRSIHNNDLLLSHGIKAVWKATLGAAANKISWQHRHLLTTPRYASHSKIPRALSAHRCHAGRCGHGSAANSSLLEMSHHQFHHQLATGEERCRYRAGAPPALPGLRR